MVMMTTLQIMLYTLILYNSLWTTFLLSWDDTFNSEIHKAKNVSDTILDDGAQAKNFKDS